VDRPAPAIAEVGLFAAAPGEALLAAAPGEALLAAAPGEALLAAAPGPPPPQVPLSISNQPGSLSHPRHLNKFAHFS
jgi:hypothetical protein